MKKIIAILFIMAMLSGCTIKMIENATIEKCENCPIHTNIDIKK